MSWTRQPFQSKPSPAALKYYIHEDHSFDSGSEESAAQFMALFSQPKATPATPSPDNTLRQQELIRQFPECTFEINALSYYYGLFTPKNHLAHDPAFTRFFSFFEASDYQPSRPDIAKFRDALATRR